MLKQRTKEILIFLLENDDVIIDDICLKLNLSNKTIRNELKKIALNNFLDKYGLILQSIPGHGIKIIGTLGDKKNAKFELDKKDGLDEFFLKNPQYYIMKKLLFGKKKISISQLETSIYSSRSTIYKKIEEIRKYIKLYNLTLINKRGTYYINSDELNYRSFTFLYIKDTLYRVQENKFYNLNIFFSEQWNDEQFNDIFKKLKLFMDEIKDIFEIQFIDNEEMMLIIKMLINKSRYDEENYIELKEDTYNNIKLLKKEKEIKYIEKSYYELFNKSIEEKELYYLISQISSSQTHDIQKKTFVIESDKKSINKMNKKIALYYKLKYNFILEQDVIDYLEKILIYIFNSYTFEYNNRFKKIEFDNLNLNVDDDYINILEIIKKEKNVEEFYKETIKNIVNYINYKLDKKIKVSIIYDASYDEIKLLVEIIKKYITNIELIEVIPVTIYKRYKKETQLIISNVNMSDIKVPFFKLEKEINLNNLNKLNEFILSYYNTINKGKK